MDIENIVIKPGKTIKKIASKEPISQWEKELCKIFNKEQTKENAILLIKCKCTNNIFDFDLICTRSVNYELCRKCWSDKIITEDDLNG